MGWPGIFLLGLPAGLNHVWGFSSLPCDLSLLIFQGLYPYSPNLFMLQLSSKRTETRTSGSYTSKNQKSQNVISVTVFSQFVCLLSKQGKRQSSFMGRENLMGVVANSHSRKDRDFKNKLLRLYDWFQSPGFLLLFQRNYYRAFLL